MWPFSKRKKKPAEPALPAQNSFDDPPPSADPDGSFVIGVGNVGSERLPRRVEAARGGEVLDDDLGVAQVVVVDPVVALRVAGHLVFALGGEGNPLLHYRRAGRGGQLWPGDGEQQGQPEGKHRPSRCHTVPSVDQGEG